MKTEEPIEHIESVTRELADWLATPEMQHEKLIYLHDKVIELEIEYGKMTERAILSPNQQTRDFYDVGLKRLAIEIGKAQRELDRHIDSFANKSAGGAITPAMIEGARAYPISSLIEVSKGMTRCINPAHEDKTPSMGIKDNHAHCFGCGWHGDAIAVYQQIHNVGFIEAVKALTAPR
jgi:hypothetical protein